MTVYTFDGTIDGLLTAVFDAFALHEQPEQLLKTGDTLPLFCDQTYHVVTDEEKAQRVWVGLEKHLPCEAMKLISVSWLSELPELPTPLFQYVCKVFRQGDISKNFADPDVLAVTNIARRVLHEQLRMKQFIRFQKAKDGTYLAVVSPDHDVLPIQGIFNTPFYPVIACSGSGFGAAAGILVVGHHHHVIQMFCQGLPVVTQGPVGTALGHGYIHA